MDCRQSIFAVDAVGPQGLRLGVDCDTYHRKAQIWRML